MNGAGDVNKQGPLGLHLYCSLWLSKTFYQRKWTGQAEKERMRRKM